MRRRLSAAQVSWEGGLSVRVKRQVIEPPKHIRLSSTTRSHDEREATSEIRVIRIAAEAEFDAAEIGVVHLGVEADMHRHEMDVAPGALHRVRCAKEAVPLSATSVSIAATVSSEARAKSRTERARRCGE